MIFTLSGVRVLLVGLLPSLNMCIIQYADGHDKVVKLSDFLRIAKKN